MKWRFVTVAALLLAPPVTAGLALPTWAFVPRTGKAVVVSEAIHDDLYASGGTVTVIASIDGDVAAVAGSADLAGAITGGVLAAGGTVRIAGPVGRSVRAAAGTLTLAAHVGSDAVIAGGMVVIENSTQIGRDLIVGGGNVNISGNVQRNLVIGGGEITLGGTVRGDAEVQAQRLILLPTARIGGRLRYSADQPIEVQAGAQVSGGTERMPGRAPNPQRAANPGFWLGTHLLEVLALIVLGLVALGLAPRGAAAVTREVADRFGRSLLAGFVLLVTVPVAAFLLLFTFVGIPLSVIVMLLYVATLYPGQVFVATWLGDRIVRTARGGRSARPSVYAALAVGSVILVLLFAIPYAGWLVRLVAVLLGFGALWVAVWGAVTARPSVSPPPPAPA